VRHAPEVLASIHADYASAGATVHTTATFRTRRRQVGDAWAELAGRAVEIARGAVPASHRIAGSIAPLEDCYRPDLSPADARPEHRELAQLLARSGVDLLLCETFPHVEEGLVAVEEAVATGLPVWAAFTAGPDADLLAPSQLGAAARAAVGRGAQAVLVNCVPAARTGAYVAELAGLGVPFGAYANAGAPDEGMGWRVEAGRPDDTAQYLAWAERWADQGATLLGGCCGTGPAHVAALARRFARPSR